MNKCYSIDEENYNLNSMEEVIDYLSCNGEVEVGREYYEADAVPYTTYELVDSHFDYLLESLDERICEDLGECWDSELLMIRHSNTTAYKELQDFLVTWLDKNTRINTFYKVNNSITKMLTQEDIDE